MSENINRKNTDLEYVNKIYKYIKNGMSIEEFMCKFKVSFNELKGILELCNIYGKEVDIVPRDGTLYFVKNGIKNINVNKIGLDSEKLTRTELCVVSDTHFGIFISNYIFLMIYI